MRSLWPAVCLLAACGSEGGVGVADCACPPPDARREVDVSAGDVSIPAADVSPPAVDVSPPDFSPPDAARPAADAMFDAAPTAADAAPDAPIAVAPDACPVVCPDAAPPPPDAAPDAPLSADLRLPDAAPPPPDAAPREWTVFRLFTAEDGIRAPDGLHRMADGRVLVANQNAGNIQVIDPVADAISVHVAHFPGLDKPEETADGPNGELYVSDDRAHTVLRIDPDGSHLTYKTPADGLVTPKGLAVTDDGTLLVADEGTHAITAFPAEGPPVVLADAARGARNPESLQRAADGTLYATDGAGVLRVAPDGTVDRFLGAAEARFAEAVSVDRGGDVWLSDANPDTGARVLHYTSAGELVETIPVPGPGRMLGLAALDDGRLYVAFFQHDAAGELSEIWALVPP